MPERSSSHSRENDSTGQRPNSLKRVLVVQHDDDTDAALIGDAARRAGAQLETCVVTRNALPPSPDTFDAIVVLGSADSVNDPAIASWFEPEVGFLRKADQANIPILGICFGAQALAVALGGRVERAPYGEYGWKVIDSTNDLVPEGPWFQWHVDAIIPPADAEILARSECCVQSYRIGPHLAVQFHPEITEQHATEWPLSDPEGLAASGITAQDMLDITTALLPGAKQRADDLWHAFTRNAQAVRRT